MFCLLAEDGTALKKEIDFYPPTKSVIGLSCTMHEDTGMPQMNFKANTPLEVYSHVKNNRVATVVYILVLITMAKDVPPYLVSLYGTANDFDAQSCENR